MFGQIPDVLEALWIEVAQGDVDDARRLIEGVWQVRPFEDRYAKAQNIDWETCAKVVSEREKRQLLSAGWQRGAIRALKRLCK